MIGKVSDRVLVGTFATVALFGCLAPSNELVARPITAQQISVIDGDTIHVAGESANVRLVGFNAPETRNAECAVEHDLGDRATRRLKGLVATGRLDFTKVACSCPAGTEGTFHCNYGRSCATLRANGADVGETLISEGLAVPFICGRTSCPPTPRPWCR